MRFRHLTHTSAIALAVALMGPFMATSHAQPSNEAFAAQVKHHRAMFEKNPAAVKEAKELCQNLSPDRWLKEPRCTALQRHLSSTATRSRSGVARF